MPVDIDKLSTKRSLIDLTKHSEGDFGLDDFELQHLTHLKSKWLEGLSVNKYFDWRIGSVISFDSLNLHCSSDFNASGITRKIGLSIFTEKYDAAV